MKYESYKEYLVSPEWQRLKTLKLKQADNRCQLCNSPDKLNIHHRTYKRIYEEDLNDLTVLCSYCHYRFHEKLSKIVFDEINEYTSLIKDLKQMISMSKNEDKIKEYQIFIEVADSRINLLSSLEETEFFDKEINPIKNG